MLEFLTNVSEVLGSVPRTARKEGSKEMSLYILQQMLLSMLVILTSLPVKDSSAAGLPRIYISAAETQLTWPCPQLPPSSFLIRDTTGCREGTTETEETQLRDQEDKSSLVQALEKNRSLFSPYEVGFLPVLHAHS